MNVEPPIPRSQKFLTVFCVLMLILAVVPVFLLLLAPSNYVDDTQKLTLSCETNDEYYKTNKQFVYQIGKDFKTPALTARINDDVISTGLEYNIIDISGSSIQNSIVCSSTTGILSGNLNIEWNGIISIEGKYNGLTSKIDINIKIIEWKLQVKIPTSESTQIFRTPNRYYFKHMEISETKGLEVVYPDWTPYSGTVSFSITPAFSTVQSYLSFDTLTGKITADLMSPTIWNNSPPNSYSISINAQGSISTTPFGISITINPRDFVNNQDLQFKTNTSTLANEDIEINTTINTNFTMTPLYTWVDSYYLRGNYVVTTPANDPFGANVKFEVSSLPSGLYIYSTQDSNGYKICTINGRSKEVVNTVVTFTAILNMPNTTKQLKATKDVTLKFTQSATPTGISIVQPPSDININAYVNIGNKNPLECKDNNNVYINNDGGIDNGYSVSPTLPLGLSMNQANGQLSGIPTTPTPQTTYTVTRKYKLPDGSVLSASCNFDIWIGEKIPTGIFIHNNQTNISVPSGNNFHINDNLSVDTNDGVVLINNSASITSLDVVFSYSGPTFPSSITFDQPTGKISGNMTVLGMTQYTLICTYTYHNTILNSDTIITAQVSFTITIT